MSIVLLSTLKKFIQEELKNIKFACQSGSGDRECEVQVFIGDMPPKRQGTNIVGQSVSEDSGRNLPCLIIVPLSGCQEEGVMLSTLALVCVVYNPEGKDSEEAEGDLWILISTIIGRLAPFSNGMVLGEKFTLKSDQSGKILQWVKSELQPKPFLQATITSTWSYQGWE